MYDPESGSIVVFDKGVYDGDQINAEQFRRSVYHELAHSLLQADDGLLQRWHGATNDDGFVDEYATKSPDEDFADTFSEYFLHRQQLARIAPSKVQFMSELLTEPQEKMAMAFLDGFVDELVKTGAARVPLSLLSRLGHMMPGAAKTVGIGAGLGGAGYIVGRKKGEEKGIQEGAEGLEQGMEQAYSAGVQRGAQAMREMILKGQEGK